MKQAYLFPMAALAAVPILAGISPGSGDRRDVPRVAVGSFDSRAIAVAYIRSKATTEYVGAQHTDLMRIKERAVAAKDQELVKELDELGPAMQLRFHRQSFGTASVDAILERIEDRLPAIAAAAGVDVIVSKWELDWIAAGVDLVDVTDLLAAEFDPDEATWKVIHELVRKDPVPLDELDEGNP